MIELKNNPAGNFFLLAGPCVIEGEDMAMRIAERVVAITDKLQIPYVFKGSYRKANRSRLDSFMGIGDEKEIKSPKRTATRQNIWLSTKKITTYAVMYLTQWQESAVRFLICSRATKHLRKCSLSLLLTAIMTQSEVKNNGGNFKARAFFLF